MKINDEQSRYWYWGKLYDNATARLDRDMRDNATVSKTVVTQYLVAKIVKQQYNLETPAIKTSTDNYFDHTETWYTPEQWYAISEKHFDTVNERLYRIKSSKPVIYTYADCAEQLLLLTKRKIILSQPTRSGVTFYGGYCKRK